MRRRGFTLAEVLVAAAAVGILVSAAVPNYRRTVVRANLRAMRDVLLTIYAGEHVFASLNDGSFITVTADGDWSQIFMANPNTDAIEGITFKTFGINQVFAGVALGTGKTMAIEQDGTMCCAAGDDCPPGTAQVASIEGSLNPCP